jgi:hypothetical protein
MMMRKRIGLALVVVAAAAMAGDARDVRAAAQAGSAPSDGLKRQIERRFDVLPLRDGLVLKPRSAVRGVRSIELAGGTIAIDGVPCTGAELGDKLGADADLILRLSYLDADARRAMFAPTAERPAPQPESPSTAPAAPEPPPPPVPRTRHSDARVRIGGSATVEADESVSDVVVIGGSAHVMGEVEGDVVVIGGTAYLGPHAVVQKDVTVVGGSLSRDPNARVGGRVNQVGPGVRLNGLRVGRLPFGAAFLFGSMWGRLFAVVSTLAYLAILCLFGFLVVLIDREYVERVAARAAAEPIKAGVVGLLAQLLFLPLLIVTIILLVITIVGIPLLVLVPFAVLGLVVFFFIGFTAVAYRIGGVVSARMGSALNPHLTAVAGILVVMSPLVVGRVLGIGGAVMLPLTLPVLLIGFLAEYLAWTIGFGAVALNRFDKRSVEAGGSGR